jgi:hypothetical protein
VSKITTLTIPQQPGKNLSDFNSKLKIFCRFFTDISGFGRVRVPTVGYANNICWYKSGLASINKAPTASDRRAEFGIAELSQSPDLDRQLETII